ncbi:MAG: hypothetical protein ACLQVI_18715 [Polyangiaceae bacterium]
MRLSRASLRHLADRARATVLDAIHEPARRWRALALLGVALIFASALVTLFTPFFRNTSLYGFRDWDPTSSYRYITVLSLVRYHELPWWHPFLCGGFPAWGYAEGATNLVSPYLPLYLAFPIQIAERLEVIFSTLAALIFTYLLAGRVTRSASLRALVAVAYAINGRWVMQAAEGHGWHLQYAWLPLAIFFFDVSLQEGRLRWALYAGIVLATIAYMGGIYPLPHAALALVLYASTFAVAQRSLRPFKSLAIAGLTGIGFAAPKLFPIIDLMRHYPRKIDSSEALGLGQLVTTLVDSRGTISHGPPVYMPIWGWHEYGIYVGVWVALAMLLAVLGPSERGRASSLRATGIVFLLLGCGAFHVYAPWTLLHELPTFSSQHVPSRFLMTAVLLLALSFAALAAKSLDHAILRHGWIDLLLLAPVYFVATDIAALGLKSSKEIFTFSAPSIEASTEFHHATQLPYAYEADGKQFGAQQLLAMFANTGVIRCYGVPGELVPGAIARESPAYRGEAYVVDGAGSSSGTARVTEWTPNTATVQYAGAAPGATLVYNMNYDSSWSANGSPAIAYESAVATRVTAGAGEVKFRYYPRTLNWGLFVWFLTTLAAFGGRRVERALRG